MADIRIPDASTWLARALPFNPQDLKGWNTHYIIAGGFIHDVYHGMTPNDIDFWVFDKEGFMELVDYFMQSASVVNIYPAVVEMTLFQGGVVQLIHSESSKVVEKFDMDYVRCMYDGRDVYVTEACKRAWEDKVVRDMVPYSDIRLVRVLKAIKKGYKFETKFASWAGCIDVACPNKCSAVCNPWQCGCAFWKQAVHIDSALLKEKRCLVDTPPLEKHLIVSTRDIGVVHKYLHRVVLHNKVRGAVSNYDDVPLIDGLVN